MKNPTVLIVDDEIQIVEELCDDLSLEGWQVHGVNDGFQALDKLRAMDFDLIVSDIRMPGMDGLTLLRSVRQVNSKIIFALMTGYTEIPMWECFGLGANEVFGKPFRFEGLKSLLERSCLPMAERWGNPDRQHRAGKIRNHLDVKLRATKQTFRLGQGGFFVDPGDTSNFTPGDIISFHVETPVVVLDGMGKVRWKRRPAAGLPGGLGVEFLYLEEESRRSAIALIEAGDEKAVIPSAMSFACVR